MGSTRWYERGADAFARVATGFPRGYVCPVCRRLFPPDQLHLLRPEHVPAEQLGGARLVLTCEDCNHGAGHELQSDMRKSENPVAALRGELMEPHPVRVTHSSGATVHMDLLKSHDGFTLTGVNAANSGAAVEAFKNQMNEAVHGGRLDWSLNLDFYRDRYHPVTARVGWLRDAYLVAFTVLGYRYILDAALDVVREQLAKPRDTVIPVFMISKPDASADDRKFLIVNNPRFFRSVLIQFGRYIVLLPRIGDLDFYSRLEAQRRSSPDHAVMLSTDGQTLDSGDWPREPLFLMDFQLEHPVWQRLPVSDGG